jgi:hypothetical protein
MRGMPNIPTITLNFNQGIIGCFFGGFMLIKDENKFDISDLAKYSLFFGIFIAAA